MSAGSKSPELMAYAGEILYERYYRSARSVFKRWSCSRRTTKSDMAQTWFMLMLDLIQRVWNPDKETLTSFIERKWYNTTSLSWRYEHGYKRIGHGCGYKKSVSCDSLDMIIDEADVIEELSETPGSPLFVEYEEFENVASQLSTMEARLLRDRLYLNLKPREMSEKYGITAHSASTMFFSARAHYQKLLKERKHERQ